MKVRDFIKINADIDVYDDVCEELRICFCGPMLMTEEGEKHFAEVLDILSCMNWMCKAENDYEVEVVVKG